MNDLGWSKKFLISGSVDGSVAIRPVNYPSLFVRFVAHNGTCGGVSAAAVSFDDNYAVTAGVDGVLLVHRIRLENSRSISVIFLLPFCYLFVICLLPFYYLFVIFLLSSYFPIFDILVLHVVIIR